MGNDNIHPVKFPAIDFDENAAVPYLLSGDVIEVCEEYDTIYTWSDWYVNGVEIKQDPPRAEFGEFRHYSQIQSELLIETEQYRVIRWFLGQDH